MKYRIIVRNFMNGDISHDSSIEIERDEFEMYLSALAQDIESLDAVLSIILNDSDIEINVKKSITESQIKELIRPFLNQLKCNVKFVCSDIA